MVKGVSKQVIVVHSPDKKLFEQAIFILKEDAVGITEDALLREARRAATPREKPRGNGPVWAAAGAGLTGLAWLLTSLL